MPAVIVAAVVAINLIDRRIEASGTWAITEHASAVPIFDSDSLGVELRMSNQWFTVLYSCPVDPVDTAFTIRAEQDGATIEYDFRMNSNQVFPTRESVSPRKASPTGPFHGFILARFQNRA